MAQFASQKVLGAENKPKSKKENTCPDKKKVKKKPNEMQMKCQLKRDADRDKEMLVSYNRFKRYQQLNETRQMQMKTNQMEMKTNEMQMECKLKRDREMLQRCKRQQYIRNILGVGYEEWRLEQKKERQAHRRYLLIHTQSTNEQIKRSIEEFYDRQMQRTINEFSQ